MKKLLKTLTLTLCIMCIAFSTLIGCSSWEEIEMGYATQGPSISAKQTKKPSVSVAPSISSGVHDGQNTAPTPTPFVSLPIVLLDNEYCKVEAIGFKENSSYILGLVEGFSLQLRMHNKTPDKNIHISSDDIHINGINYSDWLYFNVNNTIAPGKTDIENLFLSSSTIIYNEIDFVRDIELDLRVYDSDTYDDLCEETVNIYPYGKEKAIPYERGYHENDIVLLDNEYITLIATEFGEINSLADYYVMRFFIANKTDKKVSININNVSINGYMADTLFYASVNANKSNFDALMFANSYLEDLAITTVEEIEFTVTVKEYSNYENTFVDEVIIVKTPN